MKRPPTVTELLTRLRLKITWRRVVLTLVLTMNLRIFQFFPGGRPLEEMWFVLCLLTLGLLYPLFKANADWKFSWLELYLLGIVGVLVLMPALSSYSVFGQPLIYGVLARRSTVLITTWLLLIHAWRYRWIDAEDVEAALIFLVWFVFAIYTGMRILFDPNAYPGAPTGFILGFGTNTQAFSVPGYLFPFGTIYYALRGLRERRIKFYLYAVAIFIDGAGASWRFLLVSVVVTLLFFLFRWRRIDEVLFTLVRLAVVVLVVGTLIQVTKPDLLSDTVGHFVAAVQVAVGGNKQEVDPSSDARVEEVNIALPYVREHPVFGVGELSGQWLSGPSEVLGGYFHDSDIGLLGTIFTYGVVGLILSSFQFVFTIRAARALPRQSHTALFDAAKGYVLFSALFSISTSFFVVAVETSTFFVVLSVLLSGDLRDKVVSGSYSLLNRSALTASA